MLGPSPSSLDYTSGERSMIIGLVVSGLISLTSLLVLFGLMISTTKKYRHTHFQAYFVCLLLSNTQQAWGTIMSLKWVVLHGVVDGPFCAAQGGIKQGGNIGAALWSFVISVHLFNLLFLRFRTPKTVSWSIIAFGWSFIFSIVFIGPVAIQSEARGHYFGISDLWCWITPAYRTEQIWLEYFFQFLAVVLNFFLHAATALRARGNILRVGGRWRMRFVPPGESWQLSLGRDYTDSAMRRVAQHMVWYPIAFAATITPAALTRISSMCGMDVPLWVQGVTGNFSDLGGFINVLLFFGVRRLFPEADSIPEFTDRKGKDDVDAIVAQHGVTPFTLTRPPSEVDADLAAAEVARSPVMRLPPAHMSARHTATASISSVDSKTPLRPY